MNNHVELIWILRTGRVNRYLINIDKLEEEEPGWTTLFTFLNYKRVSECTRPFEVKAFKHITDKIDSGEWEDTAHDCRTNRFIAFTVIAGE